MAKVLDCSFEVNEFELQSLYYVHFWTNTFGERYELPYPSLSSYWWNSITAVPLQGWLWQPTKVDISLNKETNDEGLIFSFGTFVRSEVKLQFQQQSKMVEGNFFQ